MCSQNCKNMNCIKMKCYNADCISMCSVKKEVRVVQFIHPGGEHRPSAKLIKSGGGVFPWNYGAHRRKYIKAQGDYVDWSNNYCADECLYFWGEWEPTSMVYPIISRPSGINMPHYIHEPFFDSSTYPPYHLPHLNPQKYHRQNTDPFVFNDPFLYSLCKQDKYNVLKTLAPGSIILFGSCIAPRSSSPHFVVDTIFVVKDAIPYIPDNYLTCLHGYIPKYYDKIMGFADWKDFRPKYLYRGVSYNERHEFGGMYSYVPSKRCCVGMAGFERVILRHADIDIITDNLSQGIKSSVTSQDENIKRWNDILDIVREQNCVPGVNIRFPI